MVLCQMHVQILWNHQKQRCWFQTKTFTGSMGKLLSLALTWRHILRHNILEDTMWLDLDDQVGVAKRAQFGLAVQSSPVWAQRMHRQPAGSHVEVRNGTSNWMGSWHTHRHPPWRHASTHAFLSNEGQAGVLVSHEGSCQFVVLRAAVWRSPRRRICFY